MNYFVYEFDYVNTHYKLNIGFKTDRPLLTEWNGTETDYYCCVECTGGLATLGAIDKHNYSVIHSILSTLDKAGNVNPHVYGSYFRHDINDYFFRCMGIDPNSDQPMGYVGEPSSECYIMNSYPHYITYVDNEFILQADGQTVSGQYNTSQIYTNPMLMIEILLQTLIGGYPGTIGNVELDLIVDTNVPVWDTYAHMRAFIDNGSTEGLLNGFMSPPLEDDSRYYIDNIVSNNGSISDIREENYYHFNGPDKCLGFASDDGIHATLYSYNGGPSEVKVSHDRGYTYEETSSYPSSYFVRADLSIPAYVITFNTNIPFFVGDENDSGKDKLDSYMNGTPAPSGREYSILDAWNRSDIDGTIKGVIGELVDNTVNGTSSIAYTYGVQMFSLTATQKAQFLKTILSGDVMDALVDNTKMFGQSAISALQSLRYMPIDASEVCSIGSASSCQIGSYTHTFSSSVDQILQNDKMINCGSAFFESPYEDGDFRNLEPWCRLYILLPYAGVHALTISKYINKRVTIKLAVDITSGACEYHLFANNVEMDSFTGSMGTQIPLTAEDNARHVSGIQNGLIQSIAGLTQITLSAGAAVASGGTLTPAAIAAGASGANTMAQGLQQMGNSFNNAPVDTKGASVGNLGDFGVTSPYFIFCWANSIAPKNELSIVGKPSNTGGTVGSFAGFLQVSKR